MGTYASFSFLRACLFLCVPYALLCLLLRAMRTRISSRAVYRIGNAKALLFLLPFLPCPSFLRMDSSMNLFRPADSLAAGAGTAPSGASIAADAWMQDTVTAAGHTAFYWVDKALLLFWLAGAFFTLACVLFSCRKLHSLSRDCIPAADDRTLRVFQDALRVCGIRSHVRLYECHRISSPMTYGIICPKLLLPAGFAEVSSEEQLRFVFLHELQHLRQKDQFLNPCLLLLRILYWFHPCARLLLHSQKSQRELACDEAVIRTLPRREQLTYAKTLLLFAQSSDFSSPLVFGIRGRKSVLKERVLKISDYTPGGIRKKCTGLLALVLAFLLCALSLPAVSVRSVLAAEEQSAPGTVPEQGYVTLDLSSYFGGMDGSFVLYDCNAGQYQIYNKELAQKRVSPDSVYKVCIALNALENGIIAPDNSLLAWDGTKYPLSAWNQNQTLRDAMQNSVNWYFLELDERLGAERIQQALTDYRYGNMDLSAGVSSYWLESSLKISPEEQTRFFKDFCEGTLPVSQESLDAVRQALLISTDGVSSLYGKTGTGRLDGQDINGWFSGFVETADNTYCFSINLQDSGAGGALAAQTALEILRDLGIYR